MRIQICRMEEEGDDDPLLPMILLRWKLNLLCECADFIYLASGPTIYMYPKCKGRETSRIQLDGPSDDSINFLLLDRITIPELGIEMDVLGCCTDFGLIYLYQLDQEGRLPPRKMYQGHNRGESTWGFDFKGTQSGVLLSWSDNSHSITLTHLSPSRNTGMVEDKKDTFTAHSHNIPSVKLNVGATLLVSASIDQSVKVWDVNTRQKVAEFRQFDSWAWCALFISLKGGVIWDHDDEEDAAVSFVCGDEEESVDGLIHDGASFGSGDTFGGVSDLSHHDEVGLESDGLEGGEGESDGDVNGFGSDRERDEDGGRIDMNEYDSGSVRERDEDGGRIDMNEYDSGSDRECDEDVEMRKSKIKIPKNVDHLILASSVMCLFFFYTQENQNSNHEVDESTFLAMRKNDPLVINSTQFYSGMNRIAILRFLPAPFSLLFCATQSGKVGVFRISINSQRTLSMSQKALIDVYYGVAGLSLSCITDTVVEMNILSGSSQLYKFRIYLKHFLLDV